MRRSVFHTLFALALAALSPVSSAYDIIEAMPADGEPAMGACGKPLPLEKSRRSTAARFVCDGAQIEFGRRGHIKSEFWEDWSRTERSDPSMSMSTQNEMQQIRLREAPLRWQGQAKYRTYETWTWFTRHRGANRNRCRTWIEQVPCTKQKDDLSRPIRKKVCKWVDDSPAVAPPFAAPGFGDDGRTQRSRPAPPPSPSTDPWSQSSRPRRESGPDTGRMDPGRRMRDSGDNIDRRMRSSPPPSRPSPSPSPAPRSRDYKSNSRSSLDRLKDLLLPAAHAESRQVCEWEIVGYEQMDYQTTCPVERVDTCEWEEEHREFRECPAQTINYSVEYAKPDGSWRPGVKGYHNLLPNKYDLMPGEWEEITLMTNYGQIDSDFGKGRASIVRPEVEIENPWNTYAVDFSKSPGFRGDHFACEFNREIELKAEIVTKGRIVRKAPNALAIPTDRLGRPDAVKSGERFLKDESEPAKLRPYRLQLVDTSNTTMLVAARQSRKLRRGEENEGLNAEAIVTKHQQIQKFASAADTGFWKDTLLKVKLIEKNSCALEGDKVFVDVLDTTSSLVKAEGDKLLVRLEGDVPGGGKFYKPFGLVGRVLFKLFGDIDLQLNPGMNYEFRVSMQQQGLPFYENGCLDGSITCDHAHANKALFSEELVIPFKADSRVDERSWLQWFESFHSRKLWNKFSNCAD